MSGCTAWRRRAAPDARDFDVVSPFTRLSVALVRAPRMGSSFEQYVDIGRTHDGPVTHARKSDCL